MKKFLMILPVLLVAGIIFTAPASTSATWNWGSWAPSSTPIASVAPSESPSASPSVEPSESPSSSPCIQVDEIALKDIELNPCPSVEPSASPSASPAQGNPGLTNPGPGGTSGSDGHCTYDPNRSACGGKDPVVVPAGAPATGFGPK